MLLILEMQSKKGMEKVSIQHSDYFLLAPSQWPIKMYWPDQTCSGPNIIQKLKGTKRQLSGNVAQNVLDAKIITISQVFLLFSRRSTCAYFHMSENFKMFTLFVNEISLFKNYITLYSLLPIFTNRNQIQTYCIWPVYQTYQSVYRFIDDIY